MHTITPTQKENTINAIANLVKWHKKDATRFSIYESLERLTKDGLLRRAGDSFRVSKDAKAAA